MTVRIGDQLGRYLVEDELGRGGMAAVYRALDSRLERQVAIKVIQSSFAADPQTVARFQREARTVAALEHPHILPIYDFGEHEGLPYLVMPLVEDGTLSQRLLGRPLTPDRALTWLTQLADALDAAHDAGVLHRDVKPGNVLIGRQEHLFLADFGLAKLGDAATRLTRTGMVVGTPHYMAPEVAAGESASAASDRYALAVMAYEMLTGGPPFDGESALSILHQHATKPVPSAQERAAHLPVGIDPVLVSGLAKEPGERPSTCRDFVTGLRVSFPSHDPTSDPNAATFVMPVAGKARRAGARRVVGWAVGAFVLLALVAVWALRPDGGPSPSTETETVEQGMTAEEGAAVAETTVDEAAPVDASPDSSPPSGDEPASAVDQETEPPSIVSSEPPVEDVPTASEEEGDEGAVADAGEESTALGGDRPSRPRLPFRQQNDDAARFPRQVVQAIGLMRELWFHPRFENLRALRERTNREVFANLKRTGAEILAKRPGFEAAAVSERYARGGLAYLDGELGLAMELLQTLRDEPLVFQLWGVGSMSFLSSSPDHGELTTSWQLALGYGDPSRRAGGLLSGLGEPSPGASASELYRHLGQALVDRLDGRAVAAEKRATAVWEALGSTGDADLRAHAAWIVAEAAKSRNDAVTARTWFEHAIQAGGRYRGAIAFQAGRHAVHSGQVRVGKKLMVSACQAGFLPACEASRRGIRR